MYRDLTIVNELGLHARSAAKLVQLARHASHHVWLTANGERIDAKQVIDILTLGAGKGSSVRVEIEASVDQDVLDAIAQLFIEGFGE